jgi:hypothetical protein
MIVNHTEQQHGTRRWLSTMSALISRRYLQSGMVTSINGVQECLFSFVRSSGGTV